MVISKTQLKDYAARLMFDMSDEEYDTLQQEFAVITKQMEFIENIENIKEVEPMTFPFITEKNTLRDDEIEEYLTVEEVLSNAKHQLDNQIKVPKVVEE